MNYVRGGITTLLVVALTIGSAGAALAEPPDIPIGEPDNDTYLGPRTPAEAAFEQTKLALVAAMEGRSPSRSAALAFNGANAPTACETSCDYDTGGGGGASGGTTGHLPPPSSVVLEVHARHQSTVYWCGPASGQVVINYSRGYDSTVLNGDSTATNWRSQTTIANWMKTTESRGTMGSNLAAALNRTDAVLKPIPEWSYVYGRNTDGEDLDSKVVTDVSQFAMPVVIAVMPHKSDAAYWLPSWPHSAGNAKHWIVLYGFDGIWDGTAGPQIYYTESAGNGSKDPGNYVTDAITMWKVNQYNASTIVW
ncbi:MAG: C39 family peptidase [Chloroflexota bacterium]